MKAQVRTAPVLLLAACGGLPALSAPAPASALECAVREAAELGYVRLAGETDAGVVRMGKRIPPPPGRDPLRPDRELGEVVLTDYENIPLESQIRIQHRRERLVIQVLSEREPDLATRTTGDASEDARRVIASCTTPLP